MHGQPNRKIMFNCGAVGRWGGVTPAGVVHYGIESKVNPIDFS
jgi:hypothetical protein